MTQRNTRVINKKIKLDKDSLKDFFNQRGERYTENHPYVSILYQDQNKELAAARDSYEKKLITPLLKLDGNNHLLDVGCGIGRWADSILEYLKIYVGIDFSEKLIDCAKRRFSGKLNADFVVLDAKNMSRESLNRGLFDRVIISGVLIYMNDDELKQTLTGISTVCDRNCIIYIREPLAYTQRLTLNRYWSTELNADYSAIYRTVDEMYAIFNEIFSPKGFIIRSFEKLYSDSAANNRKETGQFFTILNGS
jgi:cyclopropane fatty-acyl-phospholipid synthase-like methyltransferase